MDCLNVYLARLDFILELKIHNIVLLALLELIQILGNQHAQIVHLELIAAHLLALLALTVQQDVIAQQRLQKTINRVGLGLFL